MDEKKRADEKVTFRMPASVVDAMRRLAVDHERSLTREVIHALREYIHNADKTRRKATHDQHSDQHGDAPTG